ncbi:LacI family DNA-binding transcriptional regulator [Carboxylicivirga caseinilyticus]|uniref:LacI family DNA-binding transcriptional regulator n=1 Tax=Carboxylicivirga caseinilyticus TaxID=3417572 RepID=UPI003D3465E3|nr:LacI family DNA-binding transcriptional regulator [Marinilabiliaceae bacterium A049]
MKDKNITIIDIAKQLGVSKSTVSRALKDHPDISKATKDRVNALAKKLKYKPNATAISFRQQRSRIIGLIVPQISPFFFPSIIKAVEKEVHKRGYNLMILQSGESEKRERDNLEILLHNNVDGILASVSRKTQNFDHFESLIEEHIPIVFFDRIPKNIKADCVLIDDFDGAYRAVEHLIKTGRKKISICIGNPNLLISQNRLEAYKKALNDYALPFDDNLVISGESTLEAYKATDDLINSSHKTDSIFAISDLTMSGVMQAIYKNNIQVPDKIAVIGFCESIFSKMYQPTLSYINPLGKKIGKKAAQLLLDRIDNEESQNSIKQILLSGELVINGST